MSTFVLTHRLRLHGFTYEPRRIFAAALFNTDCFLVVNAFDGNGLDAYTPSQISFLLFVSVWSMLVVGFQIFVPRFSEQLSHKFVILGLDAITMLFWFAGFIALAVVINPLSFYFLTDLGRHTAQAAAAFGAFAW